MKAHPSKSGSAAFTLIELLVIIFTVAVIACFLIPAIVREPRRSKTVACVNNLKQVGLAFRVWAIDNRDAYPMAISTNGVVTNHPASVAPSVAAYSETNGPGSKELVDTGFAYVHFRVLSNELTVPNVLVCPNDKAKTIATNFHSALTDKNVSYFVGTDSLDIFPNMFLSGDRHLAFNKQSIKPGLFVLTTNNPTLSWAGTSHGSFGNVGLADGSVQTFSSPRLAEAARDQELATNRLAIP